MQALAELTIIDVSGSIATAYCAKNFADYGATVINLEPDAGFRTRHMRPFVAGEEIPESSAIHAYLSTNKQSMRLSSLSPDQLETLFSADLVLDDGQTTQPVNNSSRMSISWYGKTGPLAGHIASNAQMFAQNGMLRTIGPAEGPPIIPTGYQAEIVGGATAFVAAMGHLLGVQFGTEDPGACLETSIFESMLCFTEVGVISAYNTGLSASRMGVNRFPPTYPLGVFPCQDGWIGLTVLTPSQWHSFCILLNMPDFADVPMFQSSVGRLEAIDVIEPVIRARLLSFHAAELFTRAQENRIPLARVPTMDELFDVDQFNSRGAFTLAELPNTSLKVPANPYRLQRTQPLAGGRVARLGEDDD
jgi:crotonobetainyl-CoA:carnitine CoA-transferase CaiB-like acyl-CoA transferase